MSKKLCTSGRCPRHSARRELGGVAGDAAIAVTRALRRLDVDEYRARRDGRRAAVTDASAARATRLAAARPARRAPRPLPEHRDRLGLGVEAIGEQPGELVERAGDIFLAHVVRSERVVELAHRLGREADRAIAQEPLPSTCSAYGVPKRTSSGSDTRPAVRDGFITENWYC